MIDKQGNIINSYAYSPFGELIVEQEQVKLNIGFNTKYEDESGLIYYNNRYYDSDLGRFISQDPIFEEGGVNLYNFVENDPINHWDILEMYTGGPYTSVTSNELISGSNYLENYNKNNIKDNIQTEIYAPREFYKVFNEIARNDLRDLELSLTANQIASFFINTAQLVGSITIGNLAGVATSALNLFLSGLGIEGSPVTNAAVIASFTERLGNFSISKQAITSSYIGRASYQDTFIDFTTRTGDDTAGYTVMGNSVTNTIYSNNGTGYISYLSIGSLSQAENVLKNQILDKINRIPAPDKTVLSL